MAAAIKFVPQSISVTSFDDDPVRKIADAARTCYKSHHKSTPESDTKLVASLIKRKHDAMLEFAQATVTVTTSRAIANEIVRHRHFSFAQESTRYCNYGGGFFSFIDTFTDENHRQELEFFCQRAADTYQYLVNSGCRPEKARAVLPNCLATRLVIAGNIRQWRHFLALRTAPAAHPEMRQLAGDILEDFSHRTPVLFSDLD